MSWTEERCATLAKLWADGLSASQIAGRLGDVTRNAVIGKVHRLGLPGRIRASHRQARNHLAALRSARQAAVAPIRRPKTPARLPAAPASSVAVEAIEPQHSEPIAPATAVLALTGNACRWPFGDPKRDFRGFCCRPANGPYCDGHDRIAHRPASQRRR
jgi:GcrA cell cycle regulator